MTKKTKKTKSATKPTNQEIAFTIVNKKQIIEMIAKEDQKTKSLVKETT
jgi:hypothetical protein